MAISIDLSIGNSSGGGGGSVNTGVLQVSGGGALSGTLQTITDQSSNASPLQLSTTQAAFNYGGSRGLKIADSGLSNYGGIWPFSVTPSLTNYSILTQENELFLGSGGSGIIYFTSGGNVNMNSSNSGLAIGTAFGAATARLQVKGDGTSSATTALLVQNSASNTSLQVNDEQTLTGFSVSSLRFRLGYTSVGQGISTRDGQFCLGFIDANQNAGLRFLPLGSGVSYIDGWSEGTSKATNYRVVFGSRVNNTGTSITDSTTQENGTPFVFGFDVHDASAIVQINSTTRGFLPPTMTTTNRGNIVSPAIGLQLYNTTTNNTDTFDGTNWQSFGKETKIIGSLEVNIASGKVINAMEVSSTMGLGFYDSPAIIQPTTAIGEAAYVNNGGGSIHLDDTIGGYTMQQIVQALQSLGLLA